MKKVLLTIAGYDPTSGAGAVLDINVYHHLGFLGMGIITSLTAQNTQQVQHVFCPPPSQLWNQYKSLEEDVKFSGIKVGMLGCQENIQPIGRILSLNSHIPRVVDPVFQSSSGTWLLEKKAITEYLQTIACQSSLFTPNAQEASLITGLRVLTLEDMQEAAKKIFDLYRTPCLVKGGHLEKETVDILYDGKDYQIFRHHKLEARVHGTGCFLSSSLLVFLCQGETIKTACRKAVDLTHHKLEFSVRIGHGQKLFSFLRET